jgi:hypothetical protein
MKILISPGLGPVHNPSLSNGNGFRSGKPSRLHSHLVLGPFILFTAHCSLLTVLFIKSLLFI